VAVARSSVHPTASVENPRRAEPKSPRGCADTGPNTPDQGAELTPRSAAASADRPRRWAPFPFLFIFKRDHPFLISEAAVVESLRVLRTELDNPVIVLDGAVVFAIGAV
jgi:hypothetical protein